MRQVKAFLILHNTPSPASPVSPLRIEPGFVILVKVDRGVLLAIFHCKDSIAVAGNRLVARDIVDGGSWDCQAGLASAPRF